MAGKAGCLAVALLLGGMAAAQDEGEVVTKQYDDGSVYEGTFKDGLQDGSGTYRLPNGFEYSGEWVKGEITGQGRARYPNGSVYEGRFVAGKPDGQGKITYADGGSYEGDWVAGAITGNVTNSGAISINGAEMHAWYDTAPVETRRHASQPADEEGLRASQRVVQALGDFGRRALGGVHRLPGGHLEPGDAGLDHRRQRGFGDGPAAARHRQRGAGPAASAAHGARACPRQPLGPAPQRLRGAPGLVAQARRLALAELPRTGRHAGALCARHGLYPSGAAAGV